MPICWEECVNYRWRPESRENATIIRIPFYDTKTEHSEDRVYLIGGLSRILYSNISYFLFNQRKSKLMINNS